MSGTANLYYCKINESMYNGGFAHFIDRIVIRTSRSDLSKNRMYIKLNEALLFGNTERWFTQKAIEIFDMIKNHGATINASDVLDLDPMKFDCNAIHVNHYQDIRPVIDILANSGYLFPHHRMKIAEVLKEHDRCVDFATSQQGKLNKGQSKILKSIISPYLEDIIAAFSDVESVKNYLNYAAFLLKTRSESNPIQATALAYYEDSSEYEGENYTNEESVFTPKYDPEVYESLLPLGKIYSSMAEMEGTLRKLSEDGVSVPPQQSIQEFILKTLERELIKKEMRTLISEVISNAIGAADSKLEK